MRYTSININFFKDTQRQHLSKIVKMLSSLFPYRFVRFKGVFTFWKAYLCERIENDLFGCFNENSSLRKTRPAVVDFKKMLADLFSHQFNNK